MCGAGAASDLAAAGRFKGRFNAAGRFNTICFLCGAFGAPASGLLAMLEGATTGSIW